jgi:NAD(P)H dehydrogenase (quinone)
VKILLVHANPVPESFGAALHQTVLEALRRAGHEVRDLDLYAEGFQPVLDARERRAYDTPGENEAGVRAHVDALRWADALVLVFPTWWYGLPAILKGWFDRVWLPGVAFHVPEGGGTIRPGLANLRKLGVVTTAGSPRWFLKLWMRDPVKALLLRGIKRLMARGADHLWLVHYAIDGSTPKSRARFLARVSAAFEKF